MNMSFYRIILFKRGVRVSVVRLVIWARGGCDLEQDDNSEVGKKLWGAGLLSLIDRLM